jgi:hypothetical protein
MLKVVAHGEYSDFTIDGIVDVPSDFDIDREFKAFLESQHLKSRADFRRWGQVENLLAELSPSRDQARPGAAVFRISEIDLVMPWLASIGYPAIEFELVNPTLD